jgi:hypothetical protein
VVVLAFGFVVFVVEGFGVDTFEDGLVACDACWSCLSTFWRLVISVP